MRILIADDQESSLLLLQKMIEKLNSSWTIVDQAKNGEEVIEKVTILKPDLLLVDINMPKIQGIEAVKECLKVHPDLKFIFITGHDQFAVNAFEMNAVDYIVKPFQLTRLAVSLEKARQSLPHSVKETPRKQINRLPVKTSGSLHYIHTESILFIEKQERKSLIHTREQVYTTSASLEELHDQLDDRFFHSHRSFIINVMQVASIQTVGKSYVVHFYQYDETAQISKHSIREAQQRIEQYTYSSPE